MNLVKFFIDDVPFSIDNFLIIIRVVNSNLGIFLLSLKLKFKIEENNFRVLEFLGLLLETSI